MPKKKTEEQFINDLKVVDPSIKPLEPYINNATKIAFKCLLCGYQWSTTPAHILSGEGCPACARKRIADKKRYSTELFCEKLKAINSDIEVVGEYINSKTKIQVYCTKCGNKWEVVPASLLHGTGCPRCSKRYRRNTEEFKKELERISPHLTVFGKYKNAHEKIEVCCDRCGTKWFAEPNSLLKGNGCPLCSHSQTSVVEQLLFYSFTLLVGADNVSNRNKSAIGKELDIYISSLQLAIEFGAWYWHSDKLENDIDKERLCELLGIRLISIYEGCPEGAAISGLRNAICYTNTISNEKDFSTIRTLLLKLCNEYGLNQNIFNNQWESIVKTARERARKKDAETFIHELSLVNPNLTYISDYKGSKDPVYVLCNKCGTKWSAASAYDLLHGHGCPECAKDQRGLSQRMDSNSFKEQVASVNPHIVVIGKYQGSTVPVLCKCKKCNTEWMARPNSIRYKTINCPMCSPVTKKTNAVFLYELKLVNQSITPLEEYVNGTTSIRFKCDKCDFIWSTKPRNVLNGTGCPKCAIKERTKKNEKRVVCVETNTTYDSLSEASAQSGFSKSSISMCCNGKRETVGGYHWEYIDIRTTGEFSE